MDHEKTGGPAFPRTGQEVNFGDGWISGSEGMTLLDHFAGLAMQAIVDKTPLTLDLAVEQQDKFDLTAVGAYNYAAAMIEERTKRLAQTRDSDSSDAEGSPKDRKALERIVAVCAPHVNTPDGRMIYTGPDIAERFALLSDEIVAAINPSTTSR